MSDDSPLQLRPPEPRVVAEQGKFLELTEQIVKWVCGGNVASPRTLRVGGVWGDRGSGKTSMLLTVLAKLRERSDALALPVTTQFELSRANTNDAASDASRPHLFDPSRVEPQGSLFLPFINFLETRYNFIHKDLLKEIYEIEARVQHPKRFLDYQRDTACSQGDMLTGVVGFFKKSSSRAEGLARAISRVFHQPKRTVVMIDDLDLQPHRSHELIQMLELYFSEVDLTVLLASDKNQLRRSIQSKLDGAPDASLASKIVAKYVHVGWRLPVPNEADREKWLWKAPEELALDDWWKDLEDFVPPRPDGNGDGISIDGRMIQEDDQKQPVYIADVRTLLDDAVPRTWRGLNRLYNRILLCHDQYLDGSRGAQTSLGDRYPRMAKDHQGVGIDPSYIPSFLSVLFAIDESFPELDILEVYETDPSTLRMALKEFERNNGGNEDNEDDVNHELPILDRVYDDMIINGRRRTRAIGVLGKFSRYWDSYWVASTTSVGGTLGVLLTVSVNSRDARSAAMPWWEMFARHDDVTRDWNYQDHITGERPSATELRQLCAKLREDVATLPDQATIYLFMFAPLSLAAYTGWLTRYWSDVIGLSLPPGQTEMIELDWQGSERETGNQPRLLRILEVTPGEGSAAVLVVDVRPRPDTSVEVLFVDADGQQLVFAKAVKLVSSEGYLLENSDGVDDIIHDLEYALRDLRDSGMTSIHLGLACPNALGILIGRALHPYAPVSLYEYAPHAPDGPRYEYIADIG